MKALNRNEILAAKDLETKMERVEVPEWGGAVFVRVMTGSERDAFEGHFATRKYDNLRAFLAVCCVCDEKGVGLFLPTDVKSLGEKSANALDRIFPVAMRVNRLSSADIEDLEKN